MIIIEELNKPKPGLIQMSWIPKKHFYEGMPQIELYVQMQAADPEELGRSLKSVNQVNA